MHNDDFGVGILSGKDMLARPRSSQDKVFGALDEKGLLAWDPRDEDKAADKMSGSRPDLIVADDLDYTLSIDIDSGARLVAEFFGEKAAEQWRKAVTEKRNAV